ncbi:MAG: hypothetical protein IT463_11650 [Planctomycetes bacterium]|nr:hypothetical protein [Planctomycetota bacterium]
MRLLCLLIAVLALASCASTDKPKGLKLHRVAAPEWTRSGEHPSYPAETHLTGWGLAPTRRAAEEQADRNLEFAIVRHALQRNPGALQNTRFSQLVTEPGGWLQLQELAESVQRDVAGNGFEVVAVAAVHRGDLHLLAASLLPAAREAMGNAQLPPAGLSDARKLIELWGAAFLAAARVLALQLLAEGTLDRATLERCEDAASALWELPSRVRITQEGADQPVLLRGGTAKPLVLRASLRGAAVAGLPLIWQPGPGHHGVLDGESEFSAEGRASCKVLALEPNGEQYGFVLARPDLDRILNRRLGISATGWLFQLELPCRRNAELVVVLKETLNGITEGLEPVLYPALQEWARVRSVALAKDSPSPRQFPYRLRLEITLDVVTAMDGKVPVARVSGSAALTDLATGNVLYSMTPGLKREGAEGNTEIAIGLSAVKEGAGETLGEFLPRILALLPLKGEAP